MWIFKYLKCLLTEHLYVGSGYKYCLRCGKLEVDHQLQPVHVHVEH